MLKHLIGVMAALVIGVMVMAVPQAQVWNSHGMIGNEQPPKTGPAPKRDLTGTWDAGGAGIAPRGSPTSSLTPGGEKKVSTHRPGDGPRASQIGEINDPLSTMCDPAGFPRNLLFELRPFQVVHTPTQVLMLYMFEKRFRTIWTDGRALPKDPDPRWYGYSVGRWEADTTFVVATIGVSEETRRHHVRQLHTRRHRGSDAAA